jgi:hypothetical protein
VTIFQTDAPTGFRYHRADGYRLEGRGKEVVIVQTARRRMACRER